VNTTIADEITAANTTNAGFDAAVDLVDRLFYPLLTTNSAGASVGVSIRERMGETRGCQLGLEDGDGTWAMRESLGPSSAMG
jgi:nitrogen-specific signal transduction histidine kinase